MPFRKKELVSAFEIEGSLIKLTQFNRANPPVLSLLEARHAKSEKSQDVVKTLRAIISQYNVKQTRIIACVPRHKTTVKTLLLPSTVPAEIENIVTLQAAKQLPFSPDKIVSGFKILGRDKKGYSKVLTCLVHRKVVDRIMSLFKDAGVVLSKLSLSSEAITHRYISRQKEEEKKSAVCLVDVAKNAVEIAIVKQGSIELTRSVAFLPSEAIDLKIIDELKKSFFTYDKARSGVRPSKLALTGRLSVLEQEARFLKKELGLPTVFIDAVKSYSLAEGANLPAKETLKADSFTNVLALGSNYDGLEINLIPRDVQLKRLTDITKESLIMSTVLFLSILLGIGAIVAKKFIDKKNYLASIEKILDQAKPKVEKLTRLKEVTSIIKNQMELAGSSIDIVRELFYMIPDEISLTVLDYTDGQTCLLRGTADKLSSVLTFVPALEKSMYFKNVQVKYATKRRIQKGEITDFEIHCELARIK